MLRIALFLLTNLAIVIVASITLSLLGFEGYLAANGVDLNLSSLLVFCFVFGMAGSVVSLLLSKKMAKMGTGTQIIEQPRNTDEKWLIETVAELARDAGIGMPEVGIFQSQASNAFATGWNRNNALVAVSTGKSSGPFGLHIPAGLFGCLLKVTVCWRKTSSDKSQIFH